MFVSARQRTRTEPAARGSARVGISVGCARRAVRRHDGAQVERGHVDHAVFDAEPDGVVVRFSVIAHRNALDTVQVRVHVQTGDLNTQRQLGRRTPCGSLLNLVEHWLGPRRRWRARLTRGG
eukprot:6186445-Pleurochrysis_carterae.AAC.1